MEHSPNVFNSAEGLAGNLVKSAIDIEIRAYCVMEHATTENKIVLMERILEALRGKWSCARLETNWRLELVFNYKEFCVEQGLLEPDMGDLPTPKKASKGVKPPAKVKKE